MQRDIAIVGAGPVGSLLALRAIEEGLRPIVIERRAGARAGSRSIGVHPPALELLARLGLADRFLARGVRVRRGIAVGEDGAIGTIGFEGLPGPHRFVLTIAQEDTEAILAEALAARAPDALRAGTELLAIAPGSRSVVVRARGPGGEREIEVAAVVGCDGKHSAVRRALGVRFDGGPYEGRYAMADFPDTTDFREDAAVFLTREGLVESFPLPGGLRRWVVRRADRSLDAPRVDRRKRGGPGLEASRVDGAGGDGASIEGALGADEPDIHEPSADEPSVHEIVEIVQRRTGHALSPERARAHSGFRAEHFLAGQLAVGRVALAGDAAHVISPIGGQGMNLGWLGASRLATMLGRALREGRDPSRALALDAGWRRRHARAAARRAELNMWIGRPTTSPDRRELVVRALLAPPCAGVLARMFTMRGLSVGF